MANSNNPIGNEGLSANLLPKFYQTTANKKFLQATIDQLFQSGTVNKVNGYIGRQNAKSSTGEDIYVTAATTERQDYQLEPAITVEDAIGNTTFFKDYQDYINQINVFGGNILNHSRLNNQEFYSWDPHIDWDKLVNFQNYYWLPYGPETIIIPGQSLGTVSTYTVEIQSEINNNEYLFTPNGFSLNPVLTLYRGQTYKFEINSPGNPFSFKTARSIGVENRYISSAIDNYGVETGTITFTVPLDAPTILYYQSETDLNLGGVIHTASITEDTFVDIEYELLGKKSYVLPGNIPLTNGMKVAFSGRVTPKQYATGEFYVEGVGTSIKLISTSVLEVINSYTVEKTIPFDSDKFDSVPFSDATGYAGQSDYIVINRASRDRNNWSRYNRWFHKDAITFSAKFNGNVADLDQTSRAIRPIIEFEADLKLFNFGTKSINDIDLIDDFTTDAFSTIEGSFGYNVDGVPLAQGQKIIFTADTDRLVKNKIFEVTFVDVLHLNEGSRQIHLVDGSDPELNQVAYIKSGLKHQGYAYWFNGTTWLKTQAKNGVNQIPLFDIVDEDKISYGDTTVYNGSTFKGTSIFSYKIGSGINDTSLGFPLSYKNISNIGDIVFNFTLATDSFQYKQTTAINKKAISIGYLVSQDYAGNLVYKNGWQTCAVSNTQAAVRIYKNSGLTNKFNIDIFDDISRLSDLVVRVYVNGIRLNPSAWQVVTNSDYAQVVLTNDILLTDVLTIKAFASQPINNNGYYEIPVNLQNNPLNNLIGDFTLGEVTDHVNSIIDNLGTTFIGTFPGSGNLRDLGNVTQYGTKFVQHSGPMSLAIYHLTSESNNIIKSLEQARNDYNNFKRNFIKTASNLGVEGDPVVLVNLILQKINKDKPKTGPYYFSDMVPYGASIRTDLSVVDYRIKQYPLTTIFSLDILSDKAVGVYLNGGQLVYGQDYIFNNQGFIEIDNSVELHNGDTLTTYEYDSTDGAFVPETPTKLGLWPKYIPQLYKDTSLVTPRWMIQGHDGSQVLAYGTYDIDPAHPEYYRPDYRDDLILELEKRIFNNIKVKYDTNIFDISDIIPSYNRNTDYSLNEFNQVLAPSFYKWTSLAGRDFTKPLSYNADNSFTFSYSESVAPDGSSVPGYWRGIYRWMLDTDRPNICPWEMLGFTIKPYWWEEAYGPAPYTSDNLPMWQDINDGMIRQPGMLSIKIAKYAKPFLMKHIPVDSNGNLLSPIQCSMVSTPITPYYGFVFGDVSPVESAWRRSSYYPFSVILATMLLSPAKAFGLMLDRSRIKRNLAGQLVYSDTMLRVRPSDIVLPSIYSSKVRTQTAGIINYIVSYILNFVFSNNTKSYLNYQSDLQIIVPQLSYRIGAFTGKDQFKILLDSKTPLSSGSVFVPQENFKIVLNSSSPTQKITYSGVIITKTPSGKKSSVGWEIKGYSRTQPYFVYYPYTQSGGTINVGGISESFSIWTVGQQYAAGTIVQYNKQFYRSISTVTSVNFDEKYFLQLPTLPVIGGATAILRKRWDTTKPIVVPYGTEFYSIQEVVDFLLGYSEYLKNQGFVFDDFNANLQAISNWDSSVREFMFWTTQNWSAGQDNWEDWTPGTLVSYGSVVRYNGDYYSALTSIPPGDIFDYSKYNKLDGLSDTGSSVISLSPAANKLTFTTNLAVVDDITNQFYDYEISKVDGTPLNPHFLDSYRNGNTVSYSPRTTDGIYGATFYLVQHEQVVIIDNSTIFNDLIYNPESGYRQERLKISAYTSSGWYGGFDVPGFIFDQANIQQWQPWQDYALGDIVSYQGFYYSASWALPGSSDFTSANWAQLASKPVPQLIPNWTYKAGQFTDFYDLNGDNFDNAQQTMAHHLIGYQKRQYLDNIIQDDVSEFKFYQGMIREKGTQNSLNKLFNVLSSENKESLVFYEEWAIRSGNYGAATAFENIEFILDENQFRINPQGFNLTNIIDPALNFIIQQTPNDVYLKPLGYNSSPWPILKNYKPFLRSAGYVNSSDVSLILPNIEKIVSSTVVLNEGSYIWVTFEGPSWNVYRYTNQHINIKSVDFSSGVLTFATDKLIILEVGTWINISNAPVVSGYYKIVSTSLNQFSVATTLKSIPSPYTQVDGILVHSLVTQKTTSIDNIDTVLTPKLKIGELIWTDNQGNNNWAVWQYNPVYNLVPIGNTLPRSNLQFGSVIAMSKNGSIAVVSSGTIGELIVYDKVGIKTNWTQRQVIQNNPENIVPNRISIADDGSYMLVSDCLTTTGTVLLYKKDINNIFSYVKTLVNPNAQSGDEFGYSSVFGKDMDGNTVVYVSAPGISKVYTYKYSKTLQQSSSYNPVGSSLSILAVESTAGISSGMVVSGIGFTSNQTVVSIIDSKTLQLSGVPDSIPAGVISFSTIGWTENLSLRFSAPSDITGFGRTVALSGNGATIAISGLNPVTSRHTVFTYQVISDGFNIMPDSLLGPSNDIDFGNGIAISFDGTFMAISDDTLSLNGLNNRGGVTVYELIDNQYVVNQALTPHIPQSSGYFGSKISFMNDYKTLVVYSRQGNNFIDTTFDSGATIFDHNDTTFTILQVNSGRVDVYDRYISKWVFSESLSKISPIVTAEKLVVSNRYTILTVGTTDWNAIAGTSGQVYQVGTSFIAQRIGTGTGTASLSSLLADGYGVGFAVGSNQILIGAPYWVDQGLVSGTIFNYAKNPNSYTWSQLHSDVEKPDIKKVKKAFLYNKSTGSLITYLDTIDPIQGKIAGPAEEEIKFKAFYDPATYTVGDSNLVNVNAGTAWTSDQVGQLWWDLRTAKFINPYENDTAYRNTNWNTLAVGASIDIYEWVATKLKPNQWDAQADTTAGNALGISGKSLYGDNAYSIRQKYNNITKSYTYTYYFWVRNKKFIPNVPGRNMAAQDVASLIANPRGQAYTYLALTGLDSFSLINTKQYLTGKDVVLSVEYWTGEKTDQNIHSHWNIISDDPTTYIPAVIEQKWIDSLCGSDVVGRLVPDPALPPKIRYGIENRPRQGMFINRFEALKEFVETTNRILIQNQIVETYDISDLESYDQYPSVISGMYDVVFDTDAELIYANTTTITRPSIAPIPPSTTNGKITGGVILSKGKGYINAPYIKVIGSGKGASVKAKINAKGQIIGLDILSPGEGYDDSTTFTIRDYSALVKSDSKSDNTWSIYSYDSTNQSWYRSVNQSYDVRKYWSYADWYATGYNQFTVADFSVDTLAGLQDINPDIGEIVKVRIVNSGGWLLLNKYSDISSIDWTQIYSVIGIQNGTIQLRSLLYQSVDTELGFDNNIFDSLGYDLFASRELRIILNCLKNKIFINDLNSSYSDLFFDSVRYVFTEQPYIDWIFKTSFVKAQHNVGALDQPVTYKPDNLANFEDYVNEVKPYKTKVREYVSNYDGIDTAQLPITDFDLQPIYNNGSYTPMQVSVGAGKITAYNTDIHTYPWRFWLDNHGFEITEIILTSGGSNYITAPEIIISSDSGSGATARAFIVNGIVNRIVLLTPGSGYLSAPTIIFNGGLTATGGVAATASATIGNSVVRSTKIGIKFDRIDQKYYITQLQQTASFSGTGSKIQFLLTWAPDRRVGQSSVTIDGVPVLRDTYLLNVVVNKSKGYTTYSGNITFTTPPVKNASIVVNYILDQSILNATDRIQYYYNPTTGQLGKDLAQLMTGIDYGGVIVNGLGFQIANGWDSLPYYSDKWDAGDDTFNDNLLVVGQNPAGNHVLTLNYTPNAGIQLNLYKVLSGVVTTRLDDPNYAVQPYINRIINSIVYDAVLGTNCQGIHLGTTILDHININSFKSVEASWSVKNLSSQIQKIPTIASNSAVVSAIKSSTSVITNIIDGGTTPTPNFVNTTGIASGIVNAGTLLFDNISFIQAELIEFNTENYPSANYTHTEFSTVIQNTIESLIYDLLYGGNSLTVYTCQMYSGFTSLSSHWSAIFGKLNTLVQDIITNTSVTPLQYIISQESDIALSGGALAGAKLTQLVTLITSVVSGTLTSPSINNPNTNVLSVLLQSVVTTVSAQLGQLTPKVNESAIINTFLADGVTSTFYIPSSYTVSLNDEFVVRQTTSDGSVKPADADYDTSLSGGDTSTLSGVYATATGLLADDIIVDGDDLVTPTSSPATEEVIPGQVVDAVAIKVFDKPASGSATIKVDNYQTDGIEDTFALTQTPNSTGAVIVKVNGLVKTLSVDYTLDYANKNIVFETPPAANQEVSLFSIGFSGSNILDINYFVGDGRTTEFVTNALWQTPVTALVYLNGSVVKTELFRTDNTYELSNAIGIRFAISPAPDSVINYIIVSGAEHTFAITNVETISTTGAVTYRLNNQIGNSLPNESNMIVRVDQNILQGPGNSYFTLGSNRLTYYIDPTKYVPYSIANTSIVVLIGNTKLREGTDYILDLSGISIKITRKIYNNYKGQTLVVSVLSDQGYTYNPVSKEITFMNVYDNTHLVQVISSYQHDILDIERTTISVTSNALLTPNSAQYNYYKSVAGGNIKLDRPVISDYYVWVVKNTTLLTPVVDYVLNEDRQSITLSTAPSISDKITLITFGNNLLTPGIAYMQFKDMLNRVSYKRLSQDKQTTLAQDLHWNDTTIVLTDASTFEIPNPSSNRPGIIEIRGERIEYFTKTENTLGQLRRGTLGTGVYNLNIAGTPVQDIGYGSTIPYTDNQLVQQIVSDGTHIVTLNRVIYNINDIEVFVGGYNDGAIWEPGATYSIGDIVNVGSYTYRCITSHTSSSVFTTDSDKWAFFVGNRRLIKGVWTHGDKQSGELDPNYYVFNVNLAPTSTEGDVRFDSDFTLVLDAHGNHTNQIRLTNILSAGTQITVVQNTLTPWDGKYNTINVLYDTGKIAGFLKASPGIWYKEYK